MTIPATPRVICHLPLVAWPGRRRAQFDRAGARGGMIIGTIFTLFVVPSIYVLVAKTHRAEPAGEMEVRENERVPELEEAVV